jgi:alpha-galactosidase
LPIKIDLARLRLTGRGITLAQIEPLIDGAVPPHSPPEASGCAVRWKLETGIAVLEIEAGDTPRLVFRLEGIPDERTIDSLGLRFGSVDGARLYLRNGYQSWDGSFFVEPGTEAGDAPAAKAPTLGFAMTALLPKDAGGALVVGFTRHDRYQGRFNFGGSAEQPFFTAQTLSDRAGHEGTISAEPLVLIDDDGVEEALRRWSRVVAAESPIPPRIPARRITGWCSWYNLYAAIDERLILEHLAAAANFRDQREVPLEIFQVDDGFTPEMGDWLDVKPQFPRGMKPLIDDIRAAGFVPGLWIAPFLVGNRSRLYADHPDWVVQGCGGGPLAHMKFYGEFRWHKRSEEYHVLDVTHPGAAEYIRTVFRTWRREWGAGYFKTDFMNAGMEYGPGDAVWHEQGLSRVEIWRRMATIVREEIGEALWLGCGCPLWASVGLIDAARIGRDIGVSWHGDYSADSLLRDQLTRNHASGILWQGDPDCVLLREHFHNLSDEEVHSLLLFSGLSGGVLMTSDKLDEIPAQRAELFARLLSDPNLKCEFPQLGHSVGGLVVQRAASGDGTTLLNLFNTSDETIGHVLDEHGPKRAITIPPHVSQLVGRLRRPA